MKYARLGLCPVPCLRAQYAYHSNVNVQVCTDTMADLSGYTPDTHMAGASVKLVRTQRLTCIQLPPQEVQMRPSRAVHDLVTCLCHAEEAGRGSPTKVAEPAEDAPAAAQPAPAPEGPPVREPAPISSTPAPLEPQASPEAASEVPEPASAESAPADSPPEAPEESPEAAPEAFQPATDPAPSAEAAPVHQLSPAASSEAPEGSPATPPPSPEAPPAQEAALDAPAPGE